MNVKRKFKKLLEERKIKLLFIQADQIFYQETYANLLAENLDQLVERQERLERELKIKEKWTGEKAKQEKEDLFRKLTKITELVNKIVGIKTEMAALEKKEHDYAEYIDFLEKYIDQKKWRK